jgi:hypothetical protein
MSRRAFAGEALRISDLKERQAEVRLAIAAMDESPSLLVASSLERLAALLEKAEPVLNSESGSG